MNDFIFEWLENNIRDKFKTIKQYRMALLLIITTIIYCIICLLYNLIIANLTNAISNFNGNNNNLFLFNPLFMYHLGIINIFVYLVIGLIVGFWIVFPLIRWSDSQKIKETLKGSSRLKKDEEIDDLDVLSKTDDNRSISYKFGGIPVAFIDNIFRFINTTMNSVIFGITRSGKTQTVVMNGIDIVSSPSAEEQGNIFGLDPKLELYNTFRNTLIERGYEVYLLNLDDLFMSNKWEWISYLYDLYRDFYLNEDYTSRLQFVELVTLYGGLLYDSSNDKEPIWTDGGRAIFETSIYYYIRMKVEQNPDNTSILFEDYQTWITNLINIKLSDGSSFFDYMITNLEPSATEKQMYSTIFVAPTRQRSSFYSSFFNGIKLFADDGMKWIMSKNEINGRLFFKDKPVAIFIGVTDYSVARYNVISMFIEDIYQQTMRHLKKQPTKNGVSILPRRVHFFGEEIGNLCRIQDLKSKVAMTLGKGWIWNLFLQSIPQLEDLYGEKEAKHILDNCGNKIYVKSTDNETNEWFSKILGNETVTIMNHTGSLNSLILSNVNQSTEQRPLMYSNELEQLPQFHIAVKIQGEDGFVSYLKPAFERDVCNNLYEPKEEDFATKEELRTFFEKNNDFSLIEYMKESIAFISKRNNDFTLDISLHESFEEISVIESFSGINLKENNISNIQEKEQNTTFLSEDIETQKQVISYMLQTKQITKEEADKRLLELQGDVENA